MLSTKGLKPKNLSSVSIFFFHSNNLEICANANYAIKMELSLVSFGIWCKELLGIQLFATFQLKLNPVKFQKQKVD